MNFERGQDPKHTLSIGKRAQIDKWFEKWASEAEYTIGENLHIIVYGSLSFFSYLNKNLVVYLPDNLSVESNLYIRLSNITSLPENLRVEGWLDLRQTNITSLPDSLKVKGMIYKDF